MEQPGFVYSLKDIPPSNIIEIVVADLHIAFRVCRKNGPEVEICLRQQILRLLQHLVQNVERLCKTRRFADRHRCQGVRAGELVLLVDDLFGGVGVQLAEDKIAKDLCHRPLSLLALPSRLVVDHQC